MVHLIKRRHGEPERQAAELVFERVRAPERAVPLAKDGVAAARIDAEHHADAVRYGAAQPPDQLLLMRQALAVCEHADKALAPAVRADIEVPQQAAPRLFVVGRDGKIAHIVPQRRGGGVRLRLLDQAVLNIDDVVRPRAVEADLSRGDRVLALVAVIERIRRAEDLLDLDVAPAEPRERVLHALSLGPELLTVAQVAEVTPAAAAIVGAVRLTAFRRRLKQLCHLAEGGVFEHLHHQNAAQLPPDGPVDKHDLPVDARDAESLAGIALDARGIDVVFLQCGHHVLLQTQSRGNPRPCELFHRSSGAQKLNFSSSLRSCSANDASVLLSRPLLRRMSAISASPTSTSR